MSWQCQTGFGCHPPPCSALGWEEQVLGFSLPRPAIRQAKGFQQERQQPPPLSSRLFFHSQLGMPGIHRDPPGHPVPKLGIISMRAGRDSMEESRVLAQGDALEQGTSTGDALEQGTSIGDALELGTSTGDASGTTESHCGTTARPRRLRGSREKPRCLPSSPLADVSCFPVPGAAAAPHHSMPSISSSPHPWREDGAGGGGREGINISAGPGKSWGYFGAGIYGLLGIRNESVLGRGDPLIQAEGAQMSKGKWRRL